MEPYVVIAIVSTNDRLNVINCLKSLAASTYRSFCVVICENGGQEAFEQIVGSVSDLEFIAEIEQSVSDRTSITWSSDYHNFALNEGGQVVTILNAARNLGYAGGVNACIAAATNQSWDAVWVLNPDTFPDPNALAALVRHQKKDNYGIVGSRLLSVSSGLVQTWGGMEWQSWLGRGQTIGRDKPGETTPDITEVEKRIEFISGASMYVSRAYVEAIGVMDEDFFVYLEDVDWCLRRGKFKLGYAHNSIIHHIGGATSGPYTTSGSRITVYLDARNRILLARKLYGSKWPIFAIIALIHVFGQLLRPMPTRRFRFALNGWWAGLCGERGAPSFLQKK